MTTTTNRENRRTRISDQVARNQPDLVSGGFVTMAGNNEPPFQTERAFRRLRRGGRNTNLTLDEMGVVTQRVDDSVLTQLEKMRQTARQELENRRLA